jgi:hypothetical protein
MVFENFEGKAGCGCLKESGESLMFRLGSTQLDHADNGQRIRVQHALRYIAAAAANVLSHVTAPKHNVIVNSPAYVSCPQTLASKAELVLL